MSCAHRTAATRHRACHGADPLGTYDADFRRTILVSRVAGSQAPGRARGTPVAGIAALGNGTRCRHRRPHKPPSPATGARSRRSADGNGRTRANASPKGRYGYPVLRRRRSASLGCAAGHVCPVADRPGPGSDWLAVNRARKHLPASGLLPAGGRVPAPGGTRSGPARHWSSGRPTMVALSRHKKSRAVSSSASSAGSG